VNRQDDFSRRNGFNQTHEIPISVRNDAPHEFRGLMIDVALECGIKSGDLRSIVCKQLKKRPDSNNWSPINVDNEVYDLIDKCQWYEVYDILEKICYYFDNTNYVSDNEFESEINELFLMQGIGWKLVDGKVTFRGDEGLDSILTKAVAAENQQEHYTAARELHEAIKDLSGRPNPDLTGAVTHAIASLECVARDVTNSKQTMGDWLKSNQNAFPKPLDQCIDKLYGFASNHGRHLKESEEPSQEEVELVLGICATLGSYLAKKGK
jgi:hypothetical protein